MRSLGTLAAFAMLVAALMAGCTQDAPMAAIGITVDHAPPGQASFSFAGNVSIVGSNFTALDQLRAFAASESIEVETTTYSFGTAVDSIHGLAGQDVEGTFHYWQFHYNGALSQVGADAVTLAEGDRVEWRYGP